MTLHMDIPIYIPICPYIPTEIKLEKLYTVRKKKKKTKTQTLELTVAQIISFS